MKLRLVAQVLALLSAMISIFMFWPLFWAFLDGTPDVKAFSVSIAIGFNCSLPLYMGQARFVSRHWNTRPLPL